MTFPPISHMSRKYPTIMRVKLSLTLYLPVPEQPGGRRYRGGVSLRILDRGRTLGKVYSRK
jgi:hypothetical protein